MFRGLTNELNINSRIRLTLDSSIDILRYNSDYTSRSKLMKSKNKKVNK